MSSEETPRFINRDLSWLDFNQRVLYQAESLDTPLLERVRFLAIFASNLDEFFMKRVGFLKRALARGKTEVGFDGSSPLFVSAEVRTKVIELQKLQRRIFEEDIVPQLADYGVEFMKWESLGEDEKAAASTYFHERVFPILTPLAVDPAHPFPFLSNLSVSLGVRLRHPKSKESLFARIKIPDTLPQWIQINKDDSPGHRLLSLMDLVRHNLGELFPEMVIEEVTPFRVTRSADIQFVSDDAEDMMDVVEEELRLRRMAPLVRLEHPEDANKETIALLCDELEIGEKDVYEIQGELNFRAFSEIANLNIPELKYRSYSPVVPPPLAEDSSDIFRLIREKEILVHHPYETFTGTVERFIKEAVEDDNVLAIKMTLYRAGEDSPLIPLLIRAAEKGKQVVAVIELKARFDEARNIYWGEMLEKAGVHVVYGVVGKKVHSKLTLVIREEMGEYQFYGHVGTGNYNPHTAKLYTDLSLLTCNRSLTSEMIEIFNYLTGLSLKRNYKKFLVAPINMRKKFLDLISKEIKHVEEGRPGHIIAKMNSLEDQAICEALYEASQAGVKVELIVRGFCVLRPGVPGLSENISVISVIGRFLEHSRIYYFRSGAEDELDGLFFMGSADWMYRNLNNRIETVVPVERAGNRKRLMRILKMTLQDLVQSWHLQADGHYQLQKPKNDEETKGLHQAFMDRYREKAKKKKAKRK